jgi:hypothetical protein
VATASGSGDRPNGVGATAPDKEQNLKRLYQELLDYQNRHDLAAVRKLVWSSPSTLFVAKAPVGWHGYWGIDDVMQHLQDMYRTPFASILITTKRKLPFITPEIAETMHRFASPWLMEDRTPFLLWIKTAQGWRMTMDIPIPVP